MKNILTHFLMGATVVFGIQSVHGVLLVSENFADAPVGQALNAYNPAPSATSFGWSGEWTKTLINGISVSATLPTVSLPYQIDGKSAGAGIGRSMRALDPAVVSTLDSSSSYFISFALQSNASSAQFNILNGGIAGAAGAGNFVAGWRNDNADAAGGIPQYVDVSAAGETYQTIESLGTNNIGTSVYVTKIDPVNNQISYYLFNNGAAPQNPANASFKLENQAIENTRPILVDSIGIAAFGGAFAYSNILIGTTWADVTPVPEPSTMAMFAGVAALGLVYLRRRRS